MKHQIHTDYMQTARSHLTGAPGPEDNALIFFAVLTSY